MIGRSNDDTLFGYALTEENRKIIEQNSMRALGLNENSPKVVPMSEVKHFALLGFMIMTSFLKIRNTDQKGREHPK